MESQTDWRSHVREPKDIPSRPVFPGRPADETTTGHAESWTSTMNDDAREMPMVPAYVKTAAIAAVAAGTGLAVGYWLGGRRAKRSRGAFSLANADLSDFAKLAPEAAHLLKNPVVRAFAARVVMRQLSRYLAP